MEDENKSNELLNVTSLALGNILEYGTGIVIHEKHASYTILNKYAEDDEGKEMFDIVIMKYEPDNEYINGFPNGAMFVFDQDNEDDKIPKLKLVK